MNHRRYVIGLGTVLLLMPALVPSASAGNCIGTVVGLGKKQDPATGAGFLAVRSGPSVDAPVVGKLVNGDRMDVGRESGQWIYVLPADYEGWAARRYIRVRCP